MANNANTKLSRYSLMVASEVLDENSGEVYPDILSANYSEFEFTTIPSTIEIGFRYTEKPFYLIKDAYDKYIGDDILLDLNLIPHYKYLTVGAPFYIPSQIDFDNFVKLQTSISKSQKKL